ncbi:cupin domain-containing protein [Shewanella yunxiaonensis]|uniref:Cupin domain-containing protein n=1 Tax=Shewanella yunxiaonensis TaxID=2829809 RepID=A0ABX7YQB3_9GAMM|nr:cupin domain-containing protein [Shewanella yunxiaonensis]QUN04580.1 cupin domain-containing protein [Shewanella yunxiaonensis]
MYQLTIDKDKFLKEIWQQKPVIFRQAFKDFADPIAADELAGLACEEEVASRVVVTQDKGKNWQVINGPFEDYDQYGEENWQLLVQAINHWYPDCQPLVEAFRFLPDWRFDDLMASFATPGGGVGPHIDQYDVFIIQGEGRRRWTVGDIGSYQQRGGVTTSPLIENFEPIIDEILEPGDMLYIPPGFPHQGSTLTLAMSYSIGFRAPSQQELLSSMADYLIDCNQGQQRYTSTSEPSQPGMVPLAQQQGLMTLLTALAQAPETYQAMLGKLLSQNRFELDICEAERIDAEELQQALQDGAVISRIGGLKVLLLENDAADRLFINGDSFDFAAEDRDYAEILANHTSIDSEIALAMLQRNSINALLLKLLELGYCYLAEAE